MSDQSAKTLAAGTLDNAEPSDAPRPVLIIIGALAIVALIAELFVGVTSAFAPAINPPIAAAPASTQTATPASPPAPTLPVQVPPTGG
jgi:hypothetical protein